MNITYWTDFSKRKNSTKQPSGGTQATVRLKEPCGIFSPTFICSGIPESVKYVSAWGRYYFVSEVTHDGPEIQISCVSDPLATFKTAIGSTYADVEYTSSSTNTDIADPRNRPTNNVSSVVTTLLDLGDYGFSLSGGYILGIMCNQGFNYYYLTQNMFDVMCNALLDLDSVTEINNNFFNVANCIVSCMWSPYAPDHDNTLSAITVGHGDHITSMAIGNGYKITQRTELITPTVASIGFPSDTWGFDFSYLDVDPYSQGTLYLPFVGLVPLDLDVIAQSKAITLNISIDQIACEIAYKIMRASGEVIATYQGGYGATVPIASQGASTSIKQSFAPLMEIGGALTAAAGEAAGNIPMIVAGTSAALAGMGAKIKAPTIHTQINGALSSAIASRLGLAVRATVITRHPSEMSIDSAFKAVSGMPYFKGATINTLSGYVKCNGASVNINGFDSDRDIINAYMNGGFYYE